MAPRTRRFEVNREECVRLRIVAGLTITAAAKALEVTPTHLGYIETGNRHPSPELLGRLAVFYGVPVEALFSINGAESAA
jgi:transcriptional regulator with XRE-family HTH domain